MADSDEGLPCACRPRLAWLTTVRLIACARHRGHAFRSQGREVNAVTQLPYGLAEVRKVAVRKSALEWLLWVGSYRMS